MVFFNADATSEIYTCSLHDALPILEPVEAQLTKMRGERSTLTGADKQAALAKELALEKQLYQQLARMVPAPDSTVNPSRFCWWHQFFPHCDEAQFSIWRTTLGLD